MAKISTAGTFEECADELNDFVATLQRYPHTVVAFALRTHLSALLQVLVANGRWTHEEVTIFLQELGDETIPDAEPSYVRSTVGAERTRDASS